jgi:hypothetical protein
MAVLIQKQTNAGFETTPPCGENGGASGNFDYRSSPIPATMILDSRPESEKAAILHADGSTTTTMVTADGCHGGDKRRRPKYGRLKRVALAVADDRPTNTKGAALSMDQKYSIVVVDESDENQVKKKSDAVAPNVKEDSWRHSDGTPVIAIDRRFSTAALSLASSSAPYHVGSSYGSVETTVAALEKPPPDDDAASFRSSAVESRSGTMATTTAAATTKERRRRTRSQRCKHYAKRVVAVVFSTIGVLCLMVGYTVLGGYVFMRLEAPNEVAVKADVRRAMRWHVATLWSVTEQLNVLHRHNWTALAERVFDNFTREVFLATKNRGYEYGNDMSEVSPLIASLGYEVQVDVDGDEDYGELDYNDPATASKLQWNFAGSLLYSITVITTIGTTFTFAARNCSLCEFSVYRLSRTVKAYDKLLAMFV